MLPSPGRNSTSSTRSVNTRVQLVPESRLRQSPVDAPAKTVVGVVGLTASELQLMPLSVLTMLQDVPPSVVRKMSAFVPAKAVFGSVGWTATDRIAAPQLMLSSGVQLSPLSTVL